MESDNKDVRGERPGVSGRSDERDTLDETHCLEVTQADAPIEEASEEQWVGRKLGKYLVTGLLGTGGMGVVLRAHDSSIGRDVAIKVLPPAVAVNETALSRFLAEARSAGRLNHPNTVTVYEVSEADGRYFLVMELVSGGSLDERIQRDGACSVEEATRWVIQACDGLAAAHDAGVIHRDIKPANLLLTDSGVLKVSDFGLAKRLDNTTLHVTQAGQLVGTPYFMSPEQCGTGEPDARSDIYSLGATYFTLLTAKFPYDDRQSAMQVLLAHCNASPPDPRASHAAIPQQCARIIQRAMAKAPKARYQSMAEMRADLERVLGASSSTFAGHLSSLNGRPPGRSAMTRRRWLGGALLGGAFASVGGVIAWRRNQGGMSWGSVAGKRDDVVAVPKGEPIRVGVLHSTSGTMSASEAPLIESAQLAIDEINRAGGLLGRPVEAVVADGASDSETFRREAIRLIETEQVSVVFGCWTSASRKTVVPVFEERDHLLVYPLQYEGLEESPNVIYVGAAPNQQIIPAVQWAFAFQRMRRFFIVGSDYVFPRVAGEIIKDHLADLGATLVGEEYLPLGTRDTAQVVSAIQESEADAILNLINGDTNNAFFRELRAAGVSPADTPTISFSIGEAELATMDRAAMAGDYAAWNYFQSIASPENEAFVNAFKERFGDERVINDPMESCYCGVKLWGQAVSAVGTVEPDLVRREMRSQRIQAPHGQLRIDPATQHAFKTPRIGQVRADGQFEIVWTGVKPVRPEPFPRTRTAEDWKRFLHDLYSGWEGQWVGRGAAL